MNMKTCSKCRSNMIAGVAEINFSRNGLNVRLRNVPAMVCTNCDHKTLEGKLARHVDGIVQAIFAGEQSLRVREVVLEAA